ncbi:DUF2236 domain-containing protein [Nakamurella silvestris]|nr:DUF2236 domain-containing protein [Nakamurella silvestris]
MVTLNPVDALRAGLAQALRARVGGDSFAEDSRRIWTDPGERWFAPGTGIHVIHQDASMYIGGIRALLLQSLHPLAMAGVAGHSGFKGDPWGRLQRTSYYLAITTFGPAEQAEAHIAKIRSIHERVRGKAFDGRPYRASDPHLLAWVHLAEIDSFLTAYRRFGGGPLTPEMADEYVAQTALVAAKIGVPAPPGTVAELDVMLAAYRPELESTVAARDAARFLLLNPPLPLASRPGYAMLAAAAVSTLPGWARRTLRLPRIPLADGLIGAGAGKAATSTIRWAMSRPAVPA